MEDLLISSSVHNVEDLYENFDCQVNGIVEDVKFKISPNISIGGVKNLLDKSIFFQAMFRGGFKESKSDEITLTDIQEPILKVVCTVPFLKSQENGILIIFFLG